jgi:spore coat polysaccharide biosynthesis protein SpsF
MTGVFLQARIDSSRLPGKALLLIRGKALLFHAMESLKKVPADIHVLLTEEGSLAALSPLAGQAGFEIFSGSKADVLKRFCDALAVFPVDTLIRATGDNPLVSWEMASRLLKEHRKLKADYSGYFGLPTGCGVEVVRAESLLKAQRESSDPYDREHVTPYIYKNPRIFSLHRPLAPARRRASFSVSVDTQEDFDRVAAVFSAIYRDGPVALKELMAWIRSHGGVSGSSGKAAGE